jgi:hypothetical protein
MKYRTHNDEHINAAGTSYKGDLTTTYAKLVELFGEPRKASGDGKTDAEWKIEFENGDVASIYNYKNGAKYGNPNIETITEWNIGGYKSVVVELINQLIK